MLPVMVVNLDRSPDRWLDLQARASAVGITCQRISAVDGKQIKDPIRQILLSQRSGKLPLGPGEMGCFLSHRTVWQHVVDAGSWCLVLEDDAHFSGLERLLQDSAWLPPDADIVKCETVRQIVRMESEAVRVDGWTVRRLLSHHGGTAGYFISPKGAARLLDLTQSACDAVDHLMFHPDFGCALHLTIYQLDPAPVIQDYLIAGSASRRFASTLDLDRKESRSAFEGSSRPSLLRKVGREVARPYLRLSARLNRWIENRKGLYVNKRIGYRGDSA